MKWSVISFLFAVHSHLTFSCIAAIPLRFHEVVTVRRKYEGGKMPYNEYTQLRILQLNSRDICPSSIAKYLALEGITVSRKGVAKLIKKLTATGTTSKFIASFTTLIAQGNLARQSGNGRRSVITAEVCKIVEEQMRHDDKTTASQLHVHLTSLGYTLDLRTTLAAGRQWDGHLEGVPTAS